MKASKKLKLSLEYHGLKVLVFIISLMPWSAAVKFGELLGVAMAKIISKRFKRTLTDIHKVFPKKTEEEVRQIAMESWRNIGRMAGEVIKGQSMKPEQVLKKLEFRNLDKVFEYNQKGNGGILHLGHFTNWELFGIIASHKLKKTAFIARPMSNPMVDKMLTQMRKSSGSDIISAYNPFFACFRALKKGTMLGILSDQSVPSAKMYMPFLGRAAEVAPMTAMLSLKMNVPVFPVRMYRENGKIVAEGEEPIYPPQGEYSHKVLFDYTAQLKAKYEEWIKKDPSTWLWAHNRWKREKDCIKFMKIQDKQMRQDAEAQKAKKAASPAEQTPQKPTEQGGPNAL